MKRFHLVRDEDETGISGTGVVAEGVVFSDGRVALRWVAHEKTRSTVLWDDVEHVITIHGHGGRTRIDWID